MRFRGMAVGPLVSGAVPAPGMSGTAAHGAETFGFTGVAGSTTDMAIGERQFFVDVTPTGARETTFRFTNVGTAFSSIAAITFDDQGSGDESETEGHKEGGRPRRISPVPVRRPQAPGARLSPHRRTQR